MIFFIDTETGGTNPWKHSLLEVGIAAVYGNEIVDTMQAYVKRDDYVVTGTALKINGLVLSHVQNLGESPQDVVEKIKAFVTANSTGDDILAGHNVDFDRRFIQSLFFEVGEDIDNCLSHRTLDTACLIRFAKLIGKLAPDFPNGMHDASIALGYKPTYIHSVNGDILTNIWLYQKLVDIFKGDEVGT